MSFLLTQNFYKLINLLIKLIDWINLPSVVHEYSDGELEELKDCTCGLGNTWEVRTNKSRFPTHMQPQIYSSCPYSSAHCLLPHTLNMQLKSQSNDDFLGISTYPLDIGC